MEPIAFIYLLVSTVIQANAFSWLNPFAMLQENEPAASNHQPVLQSQNSSQTDSLENVNWQVVPGTEVGRHPAETLVDVNHIIRTGNTVTFDVTGYKGFYYRLQGDCDGSDVYYLRRGISAGATEIRYEQVNDRSTYPITDWHFKLLDYACQLLD
jgi:hypothetical protein